MYREIPTGNKICATKEIFQNQVILTNHVMSMRPQIDTSAPKQYDFLKSQKIKEAIKQQKQQEIDRENRNLISKITTIKPQYSNNSISSLPLKRSESSNVSNQKKKSLNKEYRKKELIKIVMENQQLLKRIQDQRSQYNVKNWNEERKWVEKYIANISDYPYKDFKPTKTLVQYWSNSRVTESQLQKRDTTLHKKLDPIQAKSQQGKYRNKDNNILVEPKQSLFSSDYQPYEPMTEEQLNQLTQLALQIQNNKNNEQNKKIEENDLQTITYNNNQEQLNQQIENQESQQQQQDQQQEEFNQIQKHDFDQKLENENQQIDSNYSKQHQQNDEIKLIEQNNDENNINNNHIINSQQNKVEIENQQLNNEAEQGVQAQESDFQQQQHSQNDEQQEGNEQN